jgi:DNA-binding protein YbaB
MYKLLQSLGGFGQFSKILPRLRQAQERLSQTNIEGEADGVRVRLHRTPAFTPEVHDIKIDQKLLKLPVHEVELRIKTAINDALKKARATHSNSQEKRLF